MNDVTADITQPPDGFAPFQGAWPPKWTRQMIFDAILVTFDLFSKPAEEHLMARLKAIEDDLMDYPCQTLRRVYRITQHPAFTEQLVTKFKKAYPQCDKTDKEISRALAFDIKTKEAIILQATLEDSVNQEKEYLLKNSKKSGELQRRVVKYPHIETIDNNTLPEIYLDWKDQLGPIETENDEQKGTPTSSISLPEQNTSAIQSISSEQQNLIDVTALEPNDLTKSSSKDSARSSTSRRVQIKNPYWRDPDLEFPEGTWQPSDGHGDPGNKNFLLFDPRGPLPELTARFYKDKEVKEDCNMAFPIYVDLSDRAFGHVVRSTISIRSKARFWPNHFRKDAKVPSNYNSKGAGYFFVDGRVGAIDNFALLGAGFEGPTPKSWNLVSGSVKSLKSILDQVPEHLEIADCYTNKRSSALQGAQGPFTENSPSGVSKRPRSPSPLGLASTGRPLKLAKTERSVLMKEIAKYVKEKASGDAALKATWDMLIPLQHHLVTCLGEHQKITNSPTDQPPRREGKDSGGKATVGDGLDNLNSDSNNTPDMN